MFEEFAGLPLHPLAVHAVVVFVPLFALASLVYALVPRLRGHLAWVTVTLAVVAPISAVVAVLSGNEFQQGRGLQLQGDLADHRELGLTTMWVTLAAAVLALVLVWARRSTGSTARSWVVRVLTALVVLGALAAAVSVVMTGDLGSRIVWEGVLG